MPHLRQADDRTRTDNLLITNQLLCQLSHIGIYDFHHNDSNGNRTRVTAVKGRCLNRLTMEPNFRFRILCPKFFSTKILGLTSIIFRYIIFSAKFLWNFGLTPRVGLEPTTTRLTAERSTDWAIEEYMITHIENRPSLCKHTKESPSTKVLILYSILL